MSHTAKRGRLRRVTIKHMYAQDGTPSGHTVIAEHEPDSNDPKEGYPSDIETPHETYDSAEAKAREHHMENVKKFGGKKGGGKSAIPAELMRGAVGRGR